MKDLFLNLKQSSELQKLGFYEPCLAVFNDSKQFRINSESTNWNDNVKNGDTTSAPLFSQAFRFFREKYKLYPHIFSQINGTFIWCVRWYVNRLQMDIPYESSNSYEEAESACLDKLIEIAKTK